jgi:hypothetical protein
LYGGRRLLDKASYPGQTRHLDLAGRQAIETYAEMMRRGLWALTDPIAFARFPDDRYVLGRGKYKALM